MTPSATSYSLDIGAKVFPLFDHLYPISGVPSMSPPLLCGGGIYDGSLQIVSTAGSSAPCAASPAAFSWCPRRLCLSPPWTPPDPHVVSAQISVLVADPTSLSLPAAFSYAPISTLVADTPSLSLPAAFSYVSPGEARYSSPVPAPCVPVSRSSMSLFYYLLVLASFPVHGYPQFSTIASLNPFAPPL